ncbi:MAG: type VI secretion system ATPase TssH, partial [Synergistaceae bacterium]|nr:type VI secretion system ATPase TssH [Synergistaceae bacterium]
DGITGSVIPPSVRGEVMQSLRENFRPEFLNRVDDIVMFKPLTMDEVKDIVKILVARLQERLADRQITLNFSDEALSFIAEAGYDPVYGARPLKRFITHNVETKLARALIGGGITDKTQVNIGVKAGNLVFSFV